MLRAIILETNHKFIEHFTTIENINIFLNNHPNVTKLEITFHEINPA